MAIALEIWSLEEVCNVIWFSGAKHFPVKQIYYRLEKDVELRRNFNAA
jgi:hypothetical protein